MLFRKHIKIKVPRFQLWFDSWVRKIRWRKDRFLTPIFLGFPYGSAGKVSAWNVGDLGSIPGLGRSPGEGKGCPLQYYDLENSMDCIVHVVAKCRTWLSNFHSPRFQKSRLPSPKSKMCKHAWWHAHKSRSMFLKCWEVAFLISLASSLSLTS